MAHWILEKRLGAPEERDPGGIIDHPATVQTRPRNGLYISRRNFLRASAGLAPSSAAPLVSCAVREARRVRPIRRVTHGPRFHWFGYYDKRQFDPSNRYLLSNEVEFEHRTPGPEDKLRVGGRQIYLMDVADVVASAAAS